MPLSCWGYILAFILGATAGYLWILSHLGRGLQNPNVIRKYGPSAAFWTLTTLGTIALARWGLDSSPVLGVFWAGGVVLAMIVGHWRAARSIFGEADIGLEKSERKALRWFIRTRLFELGRRETLQQLQGKVNKLKKDRAKQHDERLSALTDSVAQKDARINELQLELDSRKSELEMAKGRFDAYDTAVSEMAEVAVMANLNCYKGWDLRELLQVAANQLSKAFGGPDNAVVSVYFFPKEPTSVDGELPVVCTRTKNKSGRIFSPPRMRRENSIAGAAVELRRAIMYPEEAEMIPKLTEISGRKPDSEHWPTCFAVPIPYLDHSSRSSSGVERYGAVVVHRFNNVNVKDGVHMVLANAALVNLFVRLSGQDVEALVRGTRAQSA